MPDMWQFLRFLTSGDLDLWPFQLKNGTTLTDTKENVYANFNFYRVYVFFELQARMGQTDRQTDGRTDRRAGKPAMRLKGPHNHDSSHLVCMWEAVMLRSLYCTGILHPAKSTIFPPWATWKSCNVVFFAAPCWAATTYDLIKQE